MHTLSPNMECGLWQVKGPEDGSSMIKFSLEYKEKSK